ncbi:NAD(P)-binding protein [Auriscalpium vulgare]|uniref:NAD(P)-binding protein n=1 Tax=Auriscalpium vulgare TaxID=40419 RepID=A0ACB8RM61_9AGAM|nr:NAD(P)-binding protein [Auriscalpium vulgare]
MPTITPGSTVLVTGGSGYIGAWVIKYLVERRYSVVAAVRNDEQGSFIVNRFPFYAGKVTYVNVPDISKDGAYDEAVSGVDAIIHIASPVILSWTDPQEVIGPAVKGTTSILNSAYKYGTKVKRVILTSSAAAVHHNDFRPSLKPGTFFDETFWNTTAENATIDKNIDAWTVYCRSKVDAEKAGFSFIKEKKPAFDLASVLPVWNWGPYIHKVIPGISIGSSPGILLGSFKKPDVSGATAGDWVDVRDCALIHVLMLEVEAAGGERVGTTNGVFAWQDIFDILRDSGYEAPGKDTYGAGAKKIIAQFSNAKTAKLFPDFKYRDVAQSVKEMSDQLFADRLLVAKA